MRLNKLHLLLFCIGITVVPNRFVFAEITSFSDVLNPNARAEWEANAGDFTTIDFVGLTPNLIVTNQFEALGILFTDGNDLADPSGSYINDGFGLRGNPFSPGFPITITVEFDVPRTSIAVDHPGSIAFLLFQGEEQVGVAVHGVVGPGHFFGVVSTAPFDSVLFFDNPIFEIEVFIDDLHFGGAVPAPGALALLGLAGLLGRTRRRRG